MRRTSPELQRGDVIEEIDQQPVTSVNEFNKVVAGPRPRQHPRVFHVPPSRSLIHCGATALGGKRRAQWRGRVRIPL